MPALVSSDKHAEKQEQHLLSVMLLTMSLSSRENDVDRFFPAYHHAYQERVLLAVETQA